MRTIGPTELRSQFAARLSDLYGAEVPAYNLLLEVSHEVNQRAINADGAQPLRLGSIERVTAERHGAIRVGSPREMAQVASVFGAMGMEPTGFYDLRDAKPAPIPVISTAFRPVERQELAKNPFRVFTSMLVPEDRRFFDADLEKRLREFIEERELFPARLLELASRAEKDRGLPELEAEEFLGLATVAFALSSEPIDRSWYYELERISNVAADIGGVASTHINHLTPRVLDIDDLYKTMQDRGIEMIDRIQGPPRWDGPDVLLRQTSFRALAEPRRFQDGDGVVSEGTLRVRFGEVEARGIALTPAGRDLYDQLVRLVDDRSAAASDVDRQVVAAQVWQELMPTSEDELRRRDLGYFTYQVASPLPEGVLPSDLESLLSGGWITAQPIVYEDFLPRSAAGIFASNLTDQGEMDESRSAADRDSAWLSDAIGRPINVPEQLYAAESLDSLREVERRLRVTLS